MEFEDVLQQTIALLQRQGRISYGALKRRFQLDDAYLEDLKIELIEAQHLALDENGRILVWVGETTPTSVPAPVPQSAQTAPPSHPSADQAAQGEISRVERLAPEAERRQLTVLFCDLADSTRLGRQLDPEDLREVIRAYQATCVAAMQRFEGYIAQYLGDGLLVYFGYPQAHEDDAQRAVRTGLGILEAMRTLNTCLVQEKGLRLAVRIGIHTGLVVVGEMGGGDRHEHLAMGDTPNMAARLQGLAAPDTIVISAATSRLVQGYFTCQDLGTHALKGIDTPVRVYQVVGESTAQSRLDVVGDGGLTPLVGREAEVTLLRERWAQSTEGLGQAVVLSGEAGIGKSRLVRALTERAVDEDTQRLTLRCSPYHINSAFYPVIEHLQQRLQWQRDTPPEVRLATLEQAMQTTGLPMEEVVPLVATLLSVPVPDRYPPLTLSPQRQKQKLQEALVAWLLAEAARQPVLAVWEDLHWADPSTQELLGLLLDQVPTTHVLLMLTCRPEFRPPWGPRSYVTPLTLTRITRPQVEEMILRVTDGKPLPAEVVQQIVAKTDGIPLFVEELVKTILESGLVQEEDGHYVLTGPLPPLAIPATLQDALMARLDRLALVKAVAQLGAVLGREFSYELLQAVAPMDEPTLQHGLAQLVEAELLYQWGIPPRATYVFKHALIQDAAYQSLLRSTRQQYHQRIAQVLESQFPDICETQPELLAQHYTEASLIEQAVGYWHKAGQQASLRSAYREAIAHCSKGLELLQALPEIPHHQQELALQTVLGAAFSAFRGQASPEVECAYTRAWQLCQQIEDSASVAPVLKGLCMSYIARAEYQTAYEFGQHLLTLAQRQQDHTLLQEAHRALGATLLLWRGDAVAAHQHFEQGEAFYNLQPSRSRVIPQGVDTRVSCLVYDAVALWMLGYPDQARERAHQGIELAQGLSHPQTLVWALGWATRVSLGCREMQTVHERAEAMLAFCEQHELAQSGLQGVILRGWTLIMQGQGAEHIALIRQGLIATPSRQVAGRALYLTLLGEALGTVGQGEEGLTVLAEALALINEHDACLSEAEAYRLQGVLLLQQTTTDTAQAEACFQQALAIARRQQAKSWELRAAMSLSRLWQQQGKRTEAYELLAPVYDWFTEGFDTADLQEAKALLQTLSSGKAPEPGQ